MSVNKRLVKLVASIALPVILILSVICSAWAEPVIKIQLYDKELEESNLNGDELAQYAIYLVDRTIMYYQMAMLTGDLSFLKEIEPLLTEVTKSLDVFTNVPGCRAGNIAFSISLVNYEIKENLKTINSILANTKVENTYNVAEIRSLISEIDSINSMILNEISPLINSSDIDIISLSSLGLALRANQQNLMRSVYSRIQPSLFITDLIKSTKNESEYNLAIFRTLVERSISKTTDANLIKNKNLIINNTLKIVNAASQIEQKISQFNFPSKPVLSIQNNFVSKMEGLIDIIFQDILIAAFT